MNNWYKYGVFIRSDSVELEYNMRCTEYGNSAGSNWIHPAFHYITLAVL